MRRSSTLRIITTEYETVEQLRHALRASQDDATHLMRALERSRDIGTAIGILMAIHKVSRDEAFDLLRSASQNGNRKLRDLALDVVEHGCLPLQSTEAAAGCRTGRSAPSRPS